MRMRKFVEKYGVAVSVIAVMIVAFGLLIVVSPTYEECGPKHANDVAYQPWNKRPSILPVVMLCAGEAIDANNGVITALATVAVAAFTVILATVTGRQVALGRQEFIATQRPKLMVRNLYFLESASNEPIKARFTIVNSGGSAAGIVQAKVDLKAMAKPVLLPMPPSYDGPLILGAQVLEAGAYHTVEVASQVTRDDLAMTYDFYGMPSVPEKIMVLTGQVIYRDTIGTKRRMAFARRQDKDLRMVALNDLEWEYEE